MAIEIQDIKSILSAIKCSPNIRLNRCLILGDAKIYPTYGQIKKYANSINFKLIESAVEELDAISFGKCLGFSIVETLDINDQATIQQDLTKEIDKMLLDKYDLIIDAGVLFYCFEPGLALKNVYRMLRNEALVVHITAITGFFGRAYYNIHPRVLIDFYNLNGGEFLNFDLRARPYNLRISNLIISVFNKLFKNYFSNTFVDLSHTKKANRNFIYYYDSIFAKLVFSNVELMVERRRINNNSLGTFAFNVIKKDSVVKNPVLFC